LAAALSGNVGSATPAATALNVGSMLATAPAMVSKLSLRLILNAWLKKKARLVGEPGPVSWSNGGGVRSTNPRDKLKTVAFASRRGSVNARALVRKAKR
jgi:hypothetical protein